MLIESAVSIYSISHGQVKVAEVVAMKRLATSLHSSCG